MEGVDASMKMTLMVRNDFDDDDDDRLYVNAMTDDPKKGGREEGATFFTMWLCFSNILAFIKTIDQTYS